VSISLHFKFQFNQKWAIPGSIRDVAGTVKTHLAADREDDDGGR
jgi:hypothetical protein